MNTTAIELFEQWLPVLAELDTTLLLYGEDGVGADELAAAVHTLGRRRHGPLVTVDCGTLTAERFAPVLVGAWSRRLPSLHPHARGALAEAQGGTLLLSGVDTLALDVQPRLRRVLEDGAFTPTGADHPVGLDVRVIATAASDLTGEMERGAFRADLFYRLAVFPVRIPAAPRAARRPGAAGPAPGAGDRPRDGPAHAHAEPGRAHRALPISLARQRAGADGGARAGGPASRRPAHRRDRGAARRPVPRPGRPAGVYLRGAREGWTVAGHGNVTGGKSGLHRAGCWVTPRGGNPTESATENRPPLARAVRVKR